MRNLKQSIKVTDLDGNVTIYESIKDFCEESGYSRVTIWNAMKRGHLCTGKYKNIKIEKGD